MILHPLVQLEVFKDMSKAKEVQLKLKRMLQLREAKTFSKDNQHQLANSETIIEK
jgi:hypothetical protein